MSIFDTVRGIGSKVHQNGGLMGAANYASGGQANKTTAVPSSAPPWMSYVNQVNNGIMGGLKNQSEAGNKQSAQTPSNPGQSAQQGLRPLQTPMPGKNGYTPTNAPHGMDMSNPGVQEQFWNQNQKLWTNGAFQGPGQGEQFWNQVQGNFNKASQDLTPQFNAYYDQARDSAVGAANQQAAARGAYGSSKALNNVGNVIADVEGQRAKASTDFMFQNANNQRAALGQFGDLAFGAQGMGNNRNAMDLNALNSAYGASGQAQGARGNRIQNQFNNQATMTGMYMPFLQNQYNGMLDTDQGLVTGSNEANIAGATNAVNQQSQNRAQNSQDLSNGLSLYGAFSRPSGGGGAPAAPSAPNPYSTSSYVPGYNNY